MPVIKAEFGDLVAVDGDSDVGDSGIDGMSVAHSARFACGQESGTPQVGFPA